MKKPSPVARFGIWLRTSARKGVFGLFILGLVGIGIMFLLVYPISALLDQNDRLGESKDRLELLQDHNKRLSARSERLGSDGEVERLARDLHGMVYINEQAWLIVPEIAPTTTTTAALPLAP